MKRILKRNHKQTPVRRGIALLMALLFSILLIFPVIEVYAEDLPTTDSTVEETNNALGSISGFIWDDGNGSKSTDWNGMYDADEKSIAGFTVYLYNSFDKASAIASTITESDGSYHFNDLMPGTYIVGITSITLDDIEWLLPLSETTENLITINWDNEPYYAYSNVIEITDDMYVASGINAAMRINHFPGVGGDTMGIFFDMPMAALATIYYTPDVYVNDETNLISEITSASGTTPATPKVISITASFDINAVIEIPIGESIVLMSDDDYTLTTKGIWRHFRINSGASLTLTNDIILTNFGTGMGGGVIVEADATFNMEGGEIKGNNSQDGAVYNKGIFNMSGGTVSENGGNGSDATSTLAATDGGSGIYNTGTFTMSGEASVINNIGGEGGSSHYSWDFSRVGGNGGGGVHNAGIFIMEGGDISYNTGGQSGDGDRWDNGTNAGGVLNTGTFTMYGGTISFNTSGAKPASSNSDYRDHVAGGVLSKGLFVMYGGTISDHSNGGVYIGAGALFIMNDGQILRNTGEETSGVGSGGGVTLGGGSFEMHGGAISYNKGTGAYSGAGLYMSNAYPYFKNDIGQPCHFYMDGGEISYNEYIHTGTNIGDLVAGGAYIVIRGEYPSHPEPGGTFVMTGNAKVIHNTGGQEGGGLTLDLSANTLPQYISGNVEISHNTSTRDAGGIHGGTALAGWGSGGGLYISDDVKIEYNTGGYAGGLDIVGGLYLSDRVSVSYNQTFNAFAPYLSDLEVTSFCSGGILMQSFVLISSVLEITDDVKVDNNRSVGYGGGITFDCGDSSPNPSLPVKPSITISDNASVSGNTCAGNGGGILLVDYPYQNGQTTLDISGNVKITNNTAGGDGGGIFGPDYSNITIGADVKFSGNRAGKYYYYRDTTHDAVYASNILIGTTSDIGATSENNWTIPFLQGYNGYDINSLPPVGSQEPESEPDALYVSFMRNWSTTDTTMVKEAMLGTHEDINPVQYTVKGVNADTVGGTPMHPSQMPTTNPTRTDYTFIGWNTEPDGSGVTYTGDEIVWRDTEVYAQWVYTMTLTYWNLRFDANVPIGASGSGVSVPMTQSNISTSNASNTVGGPTGAPTITNGTYVFVGWNTSPSGNGSSYSSSSTVPAQASGTTVTLYAQWVVSTYSETVPVKTGDSSQLLIWGGLMIGSTIIVLYLFYVQKRRLVRRYQRHHLGF